MLSVVARGLGAGKIMLGRFGLMPSVKMPRRQGMNVFVKSSSRKIPTPLMERVMSGVIHSIQTGVASRSNANNEGSQELRSPRR